MFVVASIMSHVGDTALVQPLFARPSVASAATFPRIAPFGIESSAQACSNDVPPEFAAHVPTPKSSGRKPITALKLALPVANVKFTVVSVFAPATGETIVGKYVGTNVIARASDFAKNTPVNATTMNNKTLPDPDKRPTIALPLRIDPREMYLHMKRLSALWG
jgi:hypothetical protein